MNDKYVYCHKCLEFKARFKPNLDYCQVCYRKLLDEYSYHDYKVEKKRIKGNALRVCEMLIEEGKIVDEIYKELNLNRAYVVQIINKYTVKCNKNGDRRPF